MDFLKMLRPADVQQLVANWQEQEPHRGLRSEIDFQPVVKCFNPIGAGSWIFTELEPNSSLAFGLCDLGMGIPELGYQCLDELATVKLRGGMRIEQDLHWRASKTLSEYATEARQLGYIRA